MLSPLLLYFLLDGMVWVEDKTSRTQVAFLFKVGQDCTCAVASASLLPLGYSWWAPLRVNLPQQENWRGVPTQGSNPRHLHCTRIITAEPPGKASHNAFQRLRSSYPLGHFSSLSRVERAAGKPSSGFILFEEHLKLSLFAEERTTWLSHSLGFFCHRPSLSSKQSRILSLRFNNRNICV